MNAFAAPVRLEIATDAQRAGIFPLDACARMFLDRSKSGLKTIIAGFGRIFDLVQRPRATVLDIARKAGVSRATVSLVLRGSDLIKKDTAAKVRQAMEEVGYVYNRAAANLRTARTNFVGMIMSDLKNPFFSEFAVGIEDRLYKLGLTPILANTNDDLERQNQVLRSMLENGVQGIILSPARGTEAEHLGFLPRSLPVILGMRRIEGCELTTIDAEFEMGGRAAGALIQSSTALVDLRRRGRGQAKLTALGRALKGRTSNDGLCKKWKCCTGGRPAVKLPRSTS
jgi:transcriptional regulator with XRE-family HTH domain